MLTKKEIKRFKALLQKNDDDLTEEELEELDELEEKMNSDSTSKSSAKSKNNAESEEMPEWAKKLMEKFTKTEPKAVKRKITNQYIYLIVRRVFTVPPVIATTLFMFIIIY